MEDRRYQRRQRRRSLVDPRHADRLLKELIGGHISKSTLNTPTSWPNSGKPEVGGASPMCNCTSGNDEDHVIRIDISGSPSSLHNSTSPFTTGPTFSGVPE